MGEKLTKAQREFLIAVRDDGDIFPIMKRYDLGYGWAVEARLVFQVGPPSSLDFRITDAGRAALSDKGRG